MVFPVVSRLAKAVPSSFLSKAFLETAEGYVVKKAESVTLADIRRIHAQGKSVQEGLGMTAPDVQGFLVNAVQRCPWLLDEITFDVFIGWVAKGNPGLAASVLSDGILVKWGMTTWAEGVVELRRLAGIPK